MKKISKITTIILIGITMLSCSKKDTSDSQQTENPIGEVLMVGTNKSSITPPIGEEIKMSGYSGRTLPFNNIHDDLYVRTVVITDQDDETTTIHISIDQLNFDSGSFIEIHNRITSEITGLSDLPISNLFISATHSHGGPSTASITHVPTVEYKTNRNNIIIQSIKTAFENKQEARMRIGTVNATNVNANRQNPHTDGEGNFVCTLEVSSGNSDKTVEFVEFINTSDKSIASIVLFGVHSTVMGQHNLQITGDLAGYASRYIENNTDSGHVSLFIMSGGGDQSPIDRTQGPEDINNNNTGVEAYGNRLGEQVVPEFNNGIFLEEINITTLVFPVPLERDWQDQDDIPDAQETRAIYGLKYTDEFVIVGTPFELFSSTVQDLRQASPFENTFIQSLTNGTGHYIPPSSTYNRVPNPTRVDPERTLYVLDQCYENRTSIFTSTAEGILKDKCFLMLAELDNN